MELRGGHLEDAPLAGERLTASLLNDERDGSALVQQAELAVDRLGVGGVAEDAAVENRAVHVGHHRANVAKAVGLARVVLKVLDVVLKPRVPQALVALVDRVDGAAGGNAEVSLREDELANGGVEGEAVDLVADGEDEVRGGAVHGVAGGDEVNAGLHDALGGLLYRVDILELILHLPNAPNGADGHIRVNVAAAVEGVEADNVRPAARLVGHDSAVLLLAAEDKDLLRGKALNLEGLVGDHIELLLLVARRVGRLITNEAHRAVDAGPADVPLNNLNRGLDGHHQKRKVSLAAGGLVLHKVLRERRGRRGVLGELGHDGYIFSLSFSVCVCAVVISNR